MKPEAVVFLSVYVVYLSVVIGTCIGSKRVPLIEECIAILVYAPIIFVAPVCLFIFCLMPSTEYTGDCIKITEDADYAYCRVHSDNGTRQEEADRVRELAIDLMTQRSHSASIDDDALARTYANRAQAIWPNAMYDDHYKGNIVYWSEHSLTIPICGQVRANRYYLREHE